jgi:hypothetical protein
MPASSIPAYLDALVAAARTALPAVDVHDGPITTNLENAALIIGSDTESGVTANDRRGIGALGLPRRRDESYDVPCQASVWSGDTDDASMSVQRAACFAIVDALDVLLSTDPSLGDVVVDSFISQVDAYQVIGDANADEDDETIGRTAAALFTISVINQIIPGA